MQLFAVHELDAAAACSVYLVVQFDVDLPRPLNNSAHDHVAQPLPIGIGRWRRADGGFQSEILDAHVVYFQLDISLFYRYAQFPIEVVPKNDSPRVRNHFRSAHDMRFMCQRYRGFTHPFEWCEHCPCTSFGF